MSSGERAGGREFRRALNVVLAAAKDAHRNDAREAEDFQSINSSAKSLAMQPLHGFVAIDHPPHRDLS
jgi:hypothetical protein